jgi:dipeptidyl aminopeptidase/acylaminoacyl peptidase
MIAQLLGARDATVADDDKASKASPLTYVSAKAPPFMIAQGAKDPIVTPTDADKLDAALKAAGVESTLIVVPEGTHGIGGPDLEKQAGDFFDKHLKPSSSQAPQ